jgi:hypothetical protein
VREEPGGFCIGGEFPEGKVLATSSAGTAGLKKLSESLAPPALAPPALEPLRRSLKPASSAPVAPQSHRRTTKKTPNTPAKASITDSTATSAKVIR